MAEAGDKIYEVSGSGETPRYFFSTRDEAERYLREEFGATFDDRVGWYREDAAGNVEEYYSIEELILG